MPKGLQNPGHKGFVGAELAYDCRACIDKTGEQFSYPPLGVENALAWRLWNNVSSQLRAVGGMDIAILGLDFTAIEVALNIYRVPLLERPLLFEKIVLIQHEADAQRRVMQQADRARREAEAKMG